MPSLTREDFQNAMQTGGALARQNVQGQQEEKLAKLRSYLSGQEAQTKADVDIGSLKRLQQEAPDGASVKVGEASVGVDPYAKMMMMQQQSGAKAVKGALDYYNKNAVKLHDRVTAAEEGLSVTNDPNNIGSTGQARTLMIKAMGMNRYNEAEAQAVLPPTMYSQFSGFLNKAGDETNPLNDAQRQSINAFFKHTLNQTQQQHEILKSNAISDYQMTPGADPQRAGMLQQQLGAPLDAHMKGIAEKYKQAQGTPQSQGQPPTPGIADRLRSFLGRQQGAPRPQPQAGQPAASQPSIQDMAAQEMARRKAAQGGSQ